MKNFLILSGGAFRGAFQVGAVEVLLESGIKFEKVFGVSTGAINGSLISQGKIKELKDFWVNVKELGQSEIFESVVGSFEEDKIKVSFSQIKKRLLKIPFKEFIFGNIKSSVLDNLNQIDGLFNMLPLKQKLLNNLTLDGFISDFYFGVTDFNSGQYTLLENKDFFNIESLVDGIVSSASMPIIAQPVNVLRTYENKFQNVLDGGVRKSSPLSDAIKHINDEEVHFYIINCNTGYIQTDTSNKSVVDILLRTIDIMMSQMFLQDLKTFIDINDLSDNTKFRKIPYTLIETKGDVLGDPLQTRQIDLRYELGRTIARKSIL